MIADQNSLKRRLRYHFFFHNMQNKVSTFVNNCLDCATFTNKKTTEPLLSHKVPKKSWETVAMDLFGSMPTSNHVIAVQYLSSRYPSAKLVKSASADKVIPALSEIYNNYGNPENQLSDNGPPFNLKKMEAFCQKRSISMQKITPLHPSSNLVETFIKPLGKTMKIAHENNTPEKEALEQLLQNYRDIPHPAASVTPAAPPRWNPPCRGEGAYH